MQYTVFQYYVNIIKTLVKSVSKLWNK